MESSVFHFLFHFKMEIFYGPVFCIFVGSQNTGVPNGHGMDACSDRAVRPRTPSMPGPFGTGCMHPVLHSALLRCTLPCRVHSGPGACTLSCTLHCFGALVHARSIRGTRCEDRVIARLLLDVALGKMSRHGSVAPDPADGVRAVLRAAQEAHAAFLTTAAGLWRGAVEPRGVREVAGVSGAREKYRERDHKTFPF